MKKTPLFILLVFVFMYLVQSYLTKDSKVEIRRLNLKVDSLQNQVDSLHAENYPCQIELSRYQTAYEIFVKRNPKAASEYGDIISNETE